MVDSETAAAAGPHNRRVQRYLCEIIIMVVRDLRKLISRKYGRTEDCEIC